MPDFAVLILLFLVVAAVLWLLIAGAAKFFQSAGLAPELAACAAIATVGTLGYACFFGYLAGSAVGIGLVSVALVAAGLSALVHRHAGMAWQPFALAGLTALLYLGCAALFVRQIPGNFAQALLFEKLPSPDNLLPYEFARAIADRLPWRAGSALAGSTHLSDRPPLQAGFNLMFALLWRAAEPYWVTQVVGTALQSLVVAALALVAGALRLRPLETVLALAVVIGSGFTFYNAIYAWPKLLAAGLFLTALVPLARAWLDKRYLTGAEACVFAVCVTLAFLSHGTVGFGLVALALVLLTQQLRPFSWRAMVIAGVVVTTLYAPWAAYGRFVDPNEGELVKLHLADRQVRPRESSVAAILRSYREVPVRDWLAGRVENLRMLFYDDRIARTEAQIAFGRAPLDAADGWAIDPSRLRHDWTSLAIVERIAEREHVARSLGLLNIAWLCLILGLILRWRMVDRPLGAMLAVTAANLAAWMLLEFTGGWTMIATASFAMIVLAMASAAVILTRTSARLALMVCGAQVAWSALLWVATAPGPLLQPQFNPLAAGLAIVALGGIAALMRGELKAR